MHIHSHVKRREGRGGTPREPTKQLFPTGHVKRGHRADMVTLVGDTCVSALFTWPRKLRRACAGSTRTADVLRLRFFFFSTSAMKGKGKIRGKSEWSLYLAKFIPHRVCTPVFNT